MKFGHSILRKIIKLVATSCQILRLNCSKIDFDWGSAPDPAGELTVLPRPIAGFKGPTSKGRGRRGKGMGKGDPTRDWESEKVAILITRVRITGRVSVSFRTTVWIFHLYSTFGDVVICVLICNTTRKLS